MTGETGKRSYVVGQTEIAARPLEPALYLVATPIGNLADITLRALETLAAADIVACEDTRVSRVLLDRYGIRRRTTAYHEHNAGEAGPKLIAALQAGQLASAALDATVEEPLAEPSPLWAMPNVLITPHTAGETRRYEDNVIDILLENMERLRRGEATLRNQVI